MSTARASALVCLVLVTCPQAIAEVIDIRGTPAGDKINKALQDSAAGHIGNQGSATLESLVLDTQTKEIKGSIKVRAKQSWGRIPVPFSVPPRKVDASVDASGNAEFIYNLDTGSVAAGISIPLKTHEFKIGGVTVRSIDFGEIKISADTVKKIMDGDLTAVAETIPNFGVAEKELRNGYKAKKDELTAQYGADFYLASEGFVQEFKPTTALNDAISLVVTGGGSSAQIMKKVGGLASAEADSIIEFFQKRGIEKASELVYSLLAGEDVNLPDTLFIKWSPILYESRQLLLKKPVGPWIPENHGAFYIVWTKSAGGAGGSGQGGNGQGSNGQGGNNGGGNRPGGGAGGAGQGGNNGGSNGGGGSNGNNNGGNNSGPGRPLGPILPPPPMPMGGGINSTPWFPNWCWCGSVSPMCRGGCGQPRCHSHTWGNRGWCYSCTPMLYYWMPSNDYGYATNAFTSPFQDRHVLISNKTQPQTLFDRGYNLYWQQRYYEATEYLAAAAHNTDSPATWYYYGLSEYALGHHDVAQKALQYAVAIEAAEGEDGKRRVNELLVRVQGSRRELLASARLAIAQDSMGSRMVVSRPFVLEQKHRGLDSAQVGTNIESIQR